MSKRLDHGKRELISDIWGKRGATYREKGVCRRIKKRGKPVWFEGSRRLDKEWSPCCDLCGATRLEGHCLIRPHDESPLPSEAESTLTCGVHVQESAGLFRAAEGESVHDALPLLESQPPRLM